MHLAVRVVALALLGLFVSGCSRSVGSKVTGQVTLDGKPLSGASVTFVPVKAKGSEKLRVNSAVTDDQGNFEIKPAFRTRITLLPGKYNVYVTKMVKQDGSLPTAEEDPGQLEAQGKLVNAVPYKYSDNPEGKPLITVDVAAGDNHFTKELSLTSK